MAALLGGGGEKPPAASAALPKKNEAAWAWYEGIGSPKTVVAPMVEGSELAFRLQCRRYGAELCVTPMINARSLVNNERFREQVLADVTGAPVEDRPLVVQFAGHDPELLLTAARYVEHLADGIDINLGCPQGIAKKGHYGAFLLEEGDLVIKIVEHLSSNLTCPVSCKIRLFDDLQATLNLVDRIVVAGASMITVHGRTKEMKQEQTGPCDWLKIAEVVRRVQGRIPVIANGGIERHSDISECMTATNADGVMISEASLGNPAVFSGAVSSKLDFAKEYVAIAREFPPPKISFIRAHLFKMAFEHLQPTVADPIRQLLCAAKNVDEFAAAIDKLTDIDEVSPTTWYRRHRANMEKKLVDAATKAAAPEPEDEDDLDTGNLFG